MVLRCFRDLHDSATGNKTDSGIRTVLKYGLELVVVRSSGVENFHAAKNQFNGKWAR